VRPDGLRLAPEARSVPKRGVVERTEDPADGPEPRELSGLSRDGNVRAERAEGSDLNAHADDDERGFQEDAVACELEA